jgi:hypothetical protein
MTSEGALGENDLVLLMLGALRLLDDFAATVRVAAPDADAAPANDHVVAAALGLLSLRRTLERWRLATVTDQPEPAAAAAAASGAGDWLR